MASGELLDGYESCPNDGLDDELCDAIPHGNRKRVARIGVDEHHGDLPAVAGINRTRRIDESNPVLRSKTGSWHDESDEAFGQCNGHSRWNQRSLAGQ